MGGDAWNDAHPCRRLCGTDHRRLHRVCRGGSPASCLTRRMETTKAIFWDNDGVLVETEHLYFQATQYVLASVGIPLTQQDYVELFLVQGRGAWHVAMERGIGPSDIERLRNERNALYGDLLAQAPRLTAGITEVLDALQGKYVMGVVTSSRKDHFDLMHRTTGLLK